MAAKYKYGLIRTNADDTNFRAWVQWIHDGLIAGGWVDPGDSGQTTISSAAHPTTTSQKKVTRIYRMNDASQAGHPVFMRLDYGSTSGSANAPGIWVTLGTGTDNASTITGVLYNASQPSGSIGFSGGLDLGTAPIVASNSTAGTVANTHSMLSAGPGYACMSMLHDASIAGFAWGIERARLESGAVDPTGLYFITSRQFTDLSRMAYIPYLAANTTNHTENNSIPFSRMPVTKAAHHQQVGVGMIFPVDQSRMPQPPMKNFLVIGSADVARYGYADIRWGTETIRYRQQGDVTVQLWAATVDSTSRILMRYD